MAEQNNHRRIDRIVEQETDFYLQHSAMLFCETAINLMMTCMEPEDVVRYLGSQARMIREFG